MSYSSATPWIAAGQTSLSMVFSRQNTGVGCLFLLQGIFLIQGWNSGIKPRSPALQVDSLLSSHQGGPFLQTTLKWYRTVFGLCGRGRGWDDFGEWHWNIYNIIYETSHQSRFDARYWMLGAGALGRPRGMVWEGRKEEGSGWGTRVYLWQIHVDIWQNQYNIVKLKNKIY